MQSIRFSGTAREYFGIWISNVVLTIVTLGVYSPWAKVRRKQFFLNHTNIEDYPFAYHASGGQLLIGRALSFVLIVLYSIITYVYPSVSFVLLPLIIFGMAWIINRSLRFNARMTSWRNVRFNWHGTYWKTLFFMVVLPVVGIASAGILLPLCSWYYYQYYAKNYAFGTTRFDAVSRIRSYYFVFVVACLMALILPAALLVILVFMATFFEFIDVGTVEELAAGGVILFSVLYIGLANFIFQTLCRNVLVRALTLGEVVQFNSKINALYLCWIIITNLLAIIVSLGLLVPWAAVRRYRYLTQKTEYQFLADEQQFVDDQREKMSAFGEEFADLEDFDVGI